MPGKGFVSNCCCGGCAEPPRDRDTRYSPPGIVQELQAFCCGCVPIQLCMSHYCGADVQNDGTLTLRRPCTEGDTKSVYRGQIPIQGDLIDVEIGFVVYGETCYLSLTIEGLGIVDDRIEITDYIRERLCPKCEACVQDEDEYIAQWILPENCYDGDGQSKLRIYGSSTTGLPPLPRCCGCPDPCDEPYALRDPYLDHSCAGQCSGCGCICSQACITVVHASQLHTNEQVKFCDGAYATSTGFVISLVRNEDTNCCQLELSETAGIRADDTSIFTGPVRVGDLLNPCPNPTAEWLFFDADIPFPDNAVQVSFTCSSCRSCQGILITQCCPGSATRVNRVLNATVNGGGSCCGTIPLVMLYDKVDSAWLVEDPNGMCGHAIELRLSCSGSSWQLTFGGSPCAQTVVNADPGSTCEPLNLAFTVPANGIGCCGGIMGGTLTITITE